MNTQTETRRNPFGVMDVPSPNDEEVTQFAASATLQRIRRRRQRKRLEPRGQLRPTALNPGQLVEPLERRCRPHHCG